MRMSTNFVIALLAIAAFACNSTTTTPPPRRRPQPASLPRPARLRPRRHGHHRQALYGRIGTGIGHEMTHGFDDQGAKCAPAGNLRNWWIDAALENFQARAKCIVDEYSEFPVVEGININGHRRPRRATLAHRAYMLRFGNVDSGGMAAGPPLKYPLEPDANEMRRLIDEAARRVIHHVESPPSPPAHNGAGGAA